MSLDRQMAAVLLRLELVSHGSTQAWNPSGGFSGEPDDKIVTLVASRPTFPHLQWRQRYEKAASAGDWLECGAVLRAATAELEAWTRRTAPRIEGKPLAEILIEDGEGHEAEVVARRFGVDAAFVRRRRLAVGRDVETGKKLVVTAQDDQVDVAATLHRRGLSQKEIALTLGISQPTVHRLLKEARFRRIPA